MCSMTKRDTWIPIGAVLRGIAGKLAAERNSRAVGSTPDLPSRELDYCPAEFGRAPRAIHFARVRRFERREPPAPSLGEKGGLPTGDQQPGIMAEGEFRGVHDAKRLSVSDASMRVGCGGARREVWDHLGHGARPSNCASTKSAAALRTESFSKIGAARRMALITVV